MLNNELLSPCGLYCGVCGIYYATINNDTALRHKLASVYGVEQDILFCRGCLSKEVFEFCKVCSIKSCAKDRNIEGCYQCHDFPCTKIESFPFEEAKKHMLRAIPLWKQKGTQEWVKSEEELFSCSECSTVMFRGARKCRKCGAMIRS